MEVEEFRGRDLVVIPSYKKKEITMNENGEEED